MKRPRVFTWHIHGSYLYYLSLTNCELYLPVQPGNYQGYRGKAGSFPWGENVHEVPIKSIKNTDFDIILFQSKKNYVIDQYEILSEKQQALPKIYLEHDPPREHPTDTKHIVDDPKIILVHVTHFNNLMWNNNRTPSVVIEHGVKDTNISYQGEKERGIVVINNLKLRDRRLGLDIFKEVRKEVPLDLVGMGSKELGGLGEISHEKLPEFISHYRFLFNPIRYTSLGLSLCEAMMVGLPIVGMATTELPMIIENSLSGYIHTNIYWLIEKMRYLLKHKEAALLLSRGAKQQAKQLFTIQRFSKDWERIFTLALDKTPEKTHTFQDPTIHNLGGIL